MTGAIIATLYSVVLVVGIFYYLSDRYKKDTASGVKEYISDNRRFLALTLGIFAVISMAQIRYLSASSIYSLAIVLKWSTLIWGLYLLAKIDFHEKKIPNRIVRAMLGILGVFCVYNLIIGEGFRTEVLLSPLIGALIGGGIMLLSFFISRKSVGMGDVKMFIVIGAYVGNISILTSMFYSFMAAAIGGIILLLFKKAGLKDFVPMAPFAFIGVALQYLLLMNGG